MKTTRSILAWITLNIFGVNWTVVGMCLLLALFAAAFSSGIVALVGPDKPEPTKQTPVVIHVHTDNAVFRFDTPGPAAPELLEL